MRHSIVANDLDIQSPVPECGQTFTSRYWVLDILGPDIGYMVVRTFPLDIDIEQVVALDTLIWFIIPVSQYQFLHSVESRMEFSHSNDMGIQDVKSVILEIDVVHAHSYLIDWLFVV